MALPQIISVDARRKLNATNPRWKLKTALQLLTLLTATVAISFFAATIPIWDANFFHNTGPRGDWTDGICIAPLTITFIATAINMAYTFVRRQSQPPKITTIICAILLVLLAPALIIAGNGSLVKAWRPAATVSHNGLLRCNLMNIFTRQCEPILYRVGEMQLGGTISGALTWILVFITFLVSLYERRASQVGERRRGARAGLKRLTLMVSGHNRRGDVEKGWHGSETRQGSHQHRGSKDRSERRPKLPLHPPRYSHRQSDSRKHYRSDIRNHSGDTVPIMFMQEPEAVYPHPGTRYL